MKRIPIDVSDAMEMLIDVLMLNKFHARYFSTGRSEYLLYLVATNDPDWRDYTLWGRCIDGAVTRIILSKTESGEPIERELVERLIKNSVNLRMVKKETA